jgi:energy-coupling factor transport system permease protein
VSSLVNPVLTRPDAPYARANPVAKLAIAAVASVALLPAGDLLTPSLILAAEIAGLPFCGVGLRGLYRRGWPLLLGAASVGVSNTLFGDAASGATLVDWGPLSVTTGDLSAGLSLAVRVLAIALPGVVAFATTDPTDLADALVQQLRLPWRFAYGALAAFRLLSILPAEWRTLGYARRARGVEAGWSPIAKIRVFGSKMFALLVGALRRGVRMATAMDARGFGSHPTRTFARPTRMTRMDWLLIVGAIVLVSAATALSLAVGSWRLVLS